ncbi:Cytochrome oxidase maturation protein cbb3-type [Dehalogenimonas formicexedens]|uniref:Cytochrome oxidase maturation protein cbb3-type n=1 Tax=Dehalogenimonas formicexedens TaxID=1839801 RepID=A0A1P8F7L0_9CHLR|nr:Cytochrome oxidase maturation protein cbb3-type [Dehalogenimonas formicexedens]
MNEAQIAQAIVTVSLLLIFGGLFIWGWKTGQFKNIEQTKYVIFKRPEDDGKSTQSPGKGEKP